MPFDGISPPSLTLSDIPAQGMVAPQAANMAAQFRPASLIQHQAAFHPLIVEPTAAKKTGWFGLEYPRFSIDSAWSFYPMFRALGYVCDPLYSTLTKRLTRKNYLELLNNSNKSTASDVVEITSITDSSRVEPLNKPLEPTTKGFKLEARHYLNFAETAAFLALSKAYYSKEKKDLHTNLDLAVSAEQGVVADVLPDENLWKSKNPIIESAMDRFKWQYRLRFGTAPLFSLGLWCGLIGNAAVITAERTAFYRPIAYDLLKRAVTEVQINNLDSGLAKEKLTDDLLKVMQQQRLDHRQEVIPHAQLHAMRPVLQQIAQDVIDKKFGFAGAIYLMGGGVLIPEDPVQSRKNLEHVRQVGVSGVAKEAKALQQTLQAEPAKIWEARISQQRNAQMNPEKPGTAGSAKRASLIRQRAELAGKGPVHGGGGNEGRRGSAGMVM